MMQILCIDIKYFSSSSGQRNTIHSEQILPWQTHSKCEELPPGTRHQTLPNFSVPPISTLSPAKISSPFHLNNLSISVQHPTQSIPCLQRKSWHVAFSSALRLQRISLLYSLGLQRHQKGCGRYLLRNAHLPNFTDRLASRQPSRLSHYTSTATLGHQAVRS